MSARVFTEMAFQTGRLKRLAMAAVRSGLSLPWNCRAVRAFVAESSARVSSVGSTRTATRSIWAGTVAARARS